MPAEVVIRQARVADVDDLFDLVCDHARYERTEATLSAEQLGGVLEPHRPTVQVFVASDGRGLLGYGSLTLDFSLWRAAHWAHLDCLFVRSCARGQGLGSKLLAFALKRASHMGADRLEWQTPEWNSRAIAFYEREGAHAETKRRFHMPL